MLRDFGCVVYRETEKGWVGGPNACWGAISNFFTREYTSLGKSKTSLKPDHDFMLIANFDCEETRPYQDLLVGIVNEITPCEFYEAEAKGLMKKLVAAVKNAVVAKTRYIKYKLLESYDQNVALLNFVRNLWHEPPGYQGYSVRFFKFLAESHNHYKDPFQRLTWANKEACPSGIRYSPGHSNVHNKGNLKIKTVEDLMNFNGNNTCFFFTT